MKQPRLWIVAGPNGSGKSTLVERYLTTNLPVVNPDNTVRDFGVSPIQAGRMALRQQNELVSSKKSFIIETTLSGKREISFVEAAKNVGYKIQFAFIAVQNEQLSMGRVAERVAGGGHDVPGEDIRRRFGRSLRNLPAVLAIADRAWILDNSENRGRLLLSMELGKTKFVSKRMPSWASEMFAQQIKRSRGMSR